MWYTSDDTKGQFFSITLVEKSGEINALVKRIKTCLNKHIAPHQLVSISVYEHAHPLVETSPDEKPIYCTIVHTAGENPVELKSIESVSTGSLEIYSY